MSKPLKFKFLLTAMYIAGIIGLSFHKSTPLFQFLTPFNLLFSAFVLYYFQQNKSQSYYFFLIFSTFLGFFIEVLGVNTGVIFGDYNYEKTLGFKVWNVPPVIGINWFIISFCVGYFVHDKLKISENKIILSIIGASIMTAFDYLVEPVAIRLGMWNWAAVAPPISNYIGWFFVSLGMQFVFFSTSFTKKNPVSNWLFYLQILFFVILNLF